MKKCILRYNTKLWDGKYKNGYSRFESISFRLLGSFVQERYSQTCLLRIQKRFAVILGFDCWVGIHATVNFVSKAIAMLGVKKVYVFYAIVSTPTPKLKLSNFLQCDCTLLNSKDNTRILLPSFLREIFFISLWLLTVHNSFFFLTGILSN